jgi:hypothetical protein
VLQTGDTFQAGGYAADSSICCLLWVCCSLLDMLLDGGFVAGKRYVAG